MHTTYVTSQAILWALFATGFAYSLPARQEVLRSNEPPQRQNWISADDNAILPEGSLERDRKFASIYDSTSLLEV
jgi:hypothetical protein